MRQLVTILIFFSFITIISLNKAYAVSSSPSTGTYSAGQTSVTLTLTANPQSGENAVSIRLTASNMTITNFVPVSGGNWVGTTGDCGGGNTFTSTTICASLAKTSDITAGETLGTITVTMGSVGSATLVKTSGNEYSDGVDSRADTGTIGTFTISSTGGNTNTLPNTSIFDENSLLSNKNLIFGLTSILLSFTAFFVIKAYTGNNFQVRVLEENKRNRQ